ncbi:MAG TPA: isoprenylcysteine carboxylmethyltransferase family protein [Chloroflexi bacterium]|nr:isoprenylcysteine carboxylmethyltransferase family protein [Chloroflexota bacterium]
MRALDYLGALFAAVLAAAEAQSGGVLGALVAVQALLAGVLILVHRKPQAEAPLGVRLLAWGAVLLPLALRTDGRRPLWAVGVSAAGLLLAIWAMASLGAAFGVAPADRGLVVRGPYRWVRHPMYTGEMLTWLAVLGVSPTWSNLVIVAMLGVVIGVRTRWEERLVAEYDRYRQSTPARFLPGVF